MLYISSRFVRSALIAARVTAAMSTERASVEIWFFAQRAKSEEL
jgi:hypothetical protein